MLIQKKTGNIIGHAAGNKIIDSVSIEWHEANKRIMHKKTTSGKEVILKFLNENQQLTEGDILFENADTIIVVEILPCDAIIVKPKTVLEIASVCYEIGNKHLPMFYLNDELLIAFELPLYNLLTQTGYDVQRGDRKLIKPLKTTVQAHAALSSDFLFSANTQHTNNIT